jgi:hypothetical protein
LTKEAIIADKRAFLSVTGLQQFWDEPDANGHYSWRFRPIWENGGDTPTKHLKIYVSCELRNSILPIGFDFTRMDQSAGTGFMGGRSKYTGGLAPWSPGGAITPQDIIDVQAQRKFLYVWGWALYNDIFPGTPMHITRFCFDVKPSGNPFTYDPKVTPDTLRFPYLYHREGNCADDECPVQTTAGRA